MHGQLERPDSVERLRLDAPRQSELPDHCGDVDERIAPRRLGVRGHARILFDDPGVGTAPRRVPVDVDQFVLRLCSFAPRVRLIEL